MSTLRVNTIQNQAGTGQPSISGLAQAWVNFNGTGTVAIRASLNVSSITDNGTGDYTVNFGTAMSDANYAVTVGQVAATQAGDGSIGSFGILTNGVMSNNATTKSASAVRFITRYMFSGGTGVFDPAECNITIFR